MKRRSLLILPSIVLLLASCGNKDATSGLMIPKDAAMVVHINSSSLASKLSWQEITQTTWFKMMHEDVPADDTVANQLLADPASSGIDTKADMLLYVKKQGSHNYMIFSGSLTDAAAFEKLCTKVHSQSNVKKDGDFSYLDLRDKAAIVWNQSHFAYAGNAPDAPMGRSKTMDGHALNNGGSERGFGVDSLRMFGMNALSLKGSDNLNDDRFTSLIKDGSDVQIWVSSGHQVAGLINTQVAMAKTDIFENNYTALSVNFDNGKITARAKKYFNDEMDKIMSNNRPQNISADVINRIPSSNVAAVLAFNYSPKALREILAATGLDLFADMALAKAGFRVDDIVNANKGEVLVALTDPSSVKKTDTTRSKKSVTISPSTKADINILFATSVNDTAAFQKMVSMGLNLLKQKMGDEAGNADVPKSLPWVNYKLQNNWFAVSNTAAFRDKFLAGGNSNVPFAGKITGHPVGLYIDLQKLSQWMGVFGSTGTENIFQDITGQGGDYKNKATAFDFEINFTDKTTNSLKQLNQYFDKVSVLHNENRKKMKEAKIKDIEVKDPPPEVKEK